MLTLSGGITRVTVTSRWGSGSTISPMPVTRARPPTRQNGMSAPSRDAASRSSRVVPKPAHRSAAAASVDPPPRPPPWGMRLSIVTWALRPASRSALATRLESSSGMPDGERPGRRQAGVGGVDDEQVVEVEADHLGVDEVVAVGADAGDVQRSRQLGVGLERHRCCVGRSHRGDVTRGCPSRVCPSRACPSRGCRRPRGGRR